jgi:serine/threonine-protein kinase RsbW
MNSGDSFKLSLTADIQYLNLAMTFIRETAKLIGFGETDIHKIELASEEAISNVIEHAFEGERGVVDIICERTPIGIKVIIRDKGIPFEPGRFQQYGQDGADLEGFTTKGLGLQIIRESMDKVFFNNLGTEGKETQLIKYLPVKKIEKHLNEDALALEEQQPERPVIREKVKFTVRRMLPHEAIEVSRCAYKSHGYTFFDDHIYYPERLVELNETDDMISVVSVTEDGRLMGHSALVYQYPDTPITELTYGFVDNEYRGQGCTTEITDYLINCPKKKPLLGIYTYIVTNHVFTQRIAVKHGINDCALLLATSPETWIFKGISDVNSQKISVVLSFKYLKQPSPVTIYAPPQHLAIIKKLFVNIGAAQHNFAAPGEASVLPAKKAEVITEIFSAENCAEIRIVSYGTDVVTEIRKILQSLCMKHIASIQLFLNLEDPLTYAMTAEFEKMKFFFAGIFPISPVGGDALLLQYLNNLDLNYDNIVLYTSIANELRNYVRKRDPNVYFSDKMP